ncbi:MAG TPA: Rieske (2Fe-2S) protein, partial [Streptosporangiaceae bacterium]|nr:Rieske (2Fe-2S) protein [Streptosporangiaceae bacterium]
AEPIGHLAGLGWHDVCPIDDLPDGRPVRRQLGYLSLFVLRRGADVSVLSDHCAHLGGPLHQGRVVGGKPGRVVSAVDGDADGDCVTCPWHGSTFRVTDGSVVHGPSTARQPSFRSQITESGMVQVQPRTLACAARRSGAARSGARRRAASRQRPLR